jgi:uncharacterized protein (TIGR02246 family)
VANAPDPAAYAAREGDTVVVLMHKVRPQRRVDYERFMTAVWFPRAQKYGAKDPEFGSALVRRWRLVATDPSERDSLYTYMFLYPAFGTLGSAYEMWRRIGLPAEQITRDSATLTALIERIDGFAAVRHEYSSAGIASAGAGPGLSAEITEERRIRELEATWRAALSAKDTAAIARYYADSGHYLPQRSDGYLGRDAIGNRWAGEINGGDFTLEREPSTIEVALSGDMAYEVGTYKVAWNKPDRGESGRGAGNYVTVWKKVAREWKIAAYIWNQGASSPP